MTWNFPRADARGKRIMKQLAYFRSISFLVLLNSPAVSL